MITIIKKQPSITLDCLYIRHIKTGNDFHKSRAEYGGLLLSAGGWCLCVILIVDDTRSCLHAESGS